MSSKHNKRSTRNESEYEVVHEEDYEIDDLPALPYEARPVRPSVSCGAQSQDSFCVPLSFDQELVINDAGNLVPLSTVATNSDNIRGVLKLKFNSSLSKAAYALYVFNATNENNRITAAHLHSGASNENGPVIVALFEGPTRISNGLLIKGVIDNRAFINNGSSNGHTVAALYQAILAGEIYANVHSEQFPDGVARGQILARFARDH